MTPKFWEMHLDPNIALDYGMFTLLVGQINLTVGTLSRYLTKRPDLAPLVDALLKGDVIGLYLLSERGHGLDALNIETTARQQEDGSYVLNTPTEEATKYINPPFLYEAFSPYRPGLCRPRTQPLVSTRSHSSWPALSSTARTVECALSSSPSATLTSFIPESSLSVNPFAAVPPP